MDNMESMKIYKISWEERAHEWIETETPSLGDPRGDLTLGPICKNEGYIETEETYKFFRDGEGIWSNMVVGFFQGMQIEGTSVEQSPQHIMGFFEEGSRGKDHKNIELYKFGNEDCPLGLKIYYREGQCNGWLEAYSTPEALSRKSRPETRASVVKLEIMELTKEQIEELGVREILDKGYESAKDIPSRGESLRAWWQRRTINIKKDLLTRFNAEKSPKEIENTDERGLSS
ncbi:MAG: hypothetical protein LBM01_02485 [Christensenellaceae bacterium]|jgi:hypothetical protein|nr:hypothetical protein [Christensenellaceae bacterium]